MHKHACLDKEKGRPDEAPLPFGQPETPSGCFTQKNMKKKGKTLEKYFPNNF
jgi:hypothetical protein